VQVDELHRAGEEGDLVGDAQLQVGRPLFGDREHRRMTLLVAVAVTSHDRADSLFTTSLRSLLSVESVAPGAWPLRARCGAR
jgi:hypothetical protein